MARCEVCDIQLDDVERFCPGCGTPAPRRVVEVSTTLRESYYGAASDDADAEYAFGGKRTFKPAPASSTIESPPPPLRPSRRRTARKRAPVGEVEVAAPDVAARAEPQPAVESAPEPDPVQRPSEEIEEASPEPAIAQAEEEPSLEGADADVDEDELDDDPGSSTEADRVPAATPAPVRVAPVVAEPVPIQPYVVLPPPRRAVALREPERPVDIEGTPEADARRRAGWKVALLLAVLVVLGGGAVFLVAGRVTAPMGQPFTAEARDGSISLDAPAGWRIESREPGVLGVGEAGHDLHVHATAIRRSALADGLSLTKRAKQVQSEFVSSLDEADASPPEPTKVGPHPAIRQVLSTSSVIYVHTVVKMPKYFVNVLAWTTAERFNEAQATLLGVVGTLQTSG